MIPWNKTCRPCIHYWTTITVTSPEGHNIPNFKELNCWSTIYPDYQQRNNKDLQPYESWRNPRVTDVFPLQRVSNMESDFLSWSLMKIRVCFIWVLSLQDINKTNIRWCHIAWWRHQMEKFSALLAICAGNSPDNGELLAQRPVTRSFIVFFDLHLFKRLNKQLKGWWFERPSHPLWRHRNDIGRHIFKWVAVTLKGWWQDEA